MGFTKIIHDGFLAPCGSQEGLPSHWMVNGQFLQLAAKMDLCFQCVLSTVCLKRNCHITYIVYRKSEDDTPVRSKIHDVLDLFKIMIYFLPSSKPPLGWICLLPSSKLCKSRKRCAWGKSLQWWMIYRMHAIYINQNLKTQYATQMPIKFSPNVSKCLITIGLSFKRHWLFSRPKVCWRLELTVAILSVTSTTKGRTTGTAVDRYQIIYSCIAGKWMSQHVARCCRYEIDSKLIPLSCFFVHSKY